MINLFVGIAEIEVGDLVVGSMYSEPMKEMQSLEAESADLT